MSDAKKIAFHYIKSNQFRVVHVDGALGGITPTGDIFVSLYSQRGPIPQKTVQEVNESGEVGDEIMEERVSRDGLVREIEIGISVRPEVAKNLINWPQKKVEEYDKAFRQKDAQPAK